MSFFLMDGIRKFQSKLTNCNDENFNFQNRIIFPFCRSFFILLGRLQRRNQKTRTARFIAAVSGCCRSQANFELRHDRWKRRRFFRQVFLFAERKRKFSYADIKGSGIIQRIWTPTPTEDTIQFYFDGEPVPRIELKFIDLFSGEKFPFIRPVCGNEVGGDYCYLPIPYRNSCKIVYKGGRMQFIQVQYKEKKPGSVVSSFPLNFSQEENEALNSVAGIWKNSGNNSFPLNQTAPNTVKSITQSVILKPGSRLPVFSLGKGGRIVRIEITPQLQLNTQFKDLIIRARWDEEPVAAFNCPLSDFFGYAFGKPSMQSLLAGVAGGVHYCNMPMPFDKKAIIELEFIKSHLVSIHKYNLKNNLTDHDNPQRPTYACGGEGGLLLCTWPKGGQLSLPFVYSNEVWTGIEYQVASHLMLKGEVEKGLDIVRECRERYDGIVRNPFNEYECGHWYARAMSSYGMLQGLTGVRYDAVSRTLFVDSKVGDFTSFISTDTGFGNVGLKKGEPFIKVVFGTIDIQKVLVSGAEKQIVE